MIRAIDIINEISLLGTSGAVPATMNKSPQITPTTEKVYNPEGTMVATTSEKLTGYLSNRGKFFTNDNFNRFTEPDMPDGSNLNQKINFIKQNSLIGGTETSKKVF